MKPFLIFAALALAGCDGASPDIRVENGWARATAPDTHSGAAYVTIVNRGGEDRLVGVEISRAASATLHESTMDGGVTRMRALPDGLAIPDDSTVVLSPNGPHIMLTGLTAPLHPGERLQATLHFARVAPQPIVILVKEASAR